MRAAVRMGDLRRRNWMPFPVTVHAEKAIALLRPLPYWRTEAVGDLTVRLRRAGHILGSSVVEVTADGDLERLAAPIRRALGRGAVVLIPAFALPGFQVAGTRGRSLLDGARAVKIFGQYVPVRAEVVGVDDLSAHADADGLLAWLRSAPTHPQVCYVVHGEPGPSESLATRIAGELGWCAVVPRHAERVLLSATPSGKSQESHAINWRES